MTPQQISQVQSYLRKRFLWRRAALSGSEQPCAVIMSQ